ncbi:MAG: Ca-activated chloride channel family protein [Sulfurimonas sp.]|jgi:Ca-activated chloride channel family protein|uniref:VWA domain-containing protein n=1 Tax=Sulfurimonas sp. TaxID=2022749 RepID=UPI0039E5A99D
MIFLRPEILYYLLPPFFILFALLLTQKETQEHYFSDEVMKKLKVGTDTFTLRTRNIFLFLVGLLIVLALAEPVIEDGTVEVKSKSADIMLALDISDSMLAEDVYPNRLSFAKQKAIDLLKLAPDERIGIVAFAKNSYLVSPMSFDHNAVSFLLRQLNTDSITEKGTDLLALLKVANETIKTKSKKYLLLLSDGGDKDDFSAEISYAKEKNIVVFILGIGTKKGAPVKKEDGTFVKYKGDIIVSKLNEDIASLATSSSGVYIQSVKSSADIKAMLSEIDSISEQKELKSETINKFIPLFYYPLGLALFLLLIATSSLYKKVQVTSPLLVLFLALAGFSQNARAGLLDFMELDKAKKAYEVGDFNTSGKIYSEYGEQFQDSFSLYNAANALYKQELYNEAIETYEKSSFEDNISNANKHGNIGNAYVKKRTPESLEKALKSYETSLDLHEDKDIRENLEAVKKALEKQKKEQEKKEDKKQDKQDDKENEEKQDKDSDEKKDSQDGKKSDEKEESEEKQEAKEDKDNKSDQKSDEEKSQEQKEQEKKQEKEKKKLEELEKDKKEDPKEEKSGAPLVDGQENMSDAEEEKWIQKLNAQQNTFMYMLGENKLDEETNDEKPW